MPFDGTTALVVGAGLLLALLPGLGLLALLGTRPADPAVRLGLAAGLSLALWPLAALWLDTLGLPYGQPAVLGVLLISSAALGAQELRRRREGGEGRARARQELAAEPSEAPSSTPSASPTVSPSERAASAALLALLVALLAARWWAASGLRVPLWGDSVHHSMILRLFALQNGLPDDWRPFAELSAFTYHFGLHAYGAALAALSGLPAPRALLVAGQLLMVLQALTLGALAAGLTGRRWAGFGAALLAAGLGPMPAFYLNWGRYTQLAGQVLLPAAALAAARAAAPREAGATTTGATTWGPTTSGPAGGGWRGALARYGPAIVALAGLALCHYLVTVFFLLFLLAWLALGDPAFAASRAGLRARGRAIVGLALVGLGGLALAAPWVPRFARGRLDGYALTLLSRRLPDEAVWGAVAPDYVWSRLGELVGWGVLAALGLGLAWGLWRRERSALTGALWAGLLVLAAYPAWLGLPITGVLKDFTVFIGLYLPAGLAFGPALAGVVGGLDAALARRSAEGDDARGGASVDAGDEGEDAGARRRAWALGLGAAGAGAALVLAGARPPEPDFALATPADEAALAWIAAETPREARFLVSSPPAYAGTVVAGEDGGWWIPLLAERATTLPPITYGFEPSYDPGYRERINALAAAWQHDLDAEETRAALREAGVGWAYVGPKALALRRERLEASPHWTLRYERDGAAVFQADWSEESGKEDAAP